jgi:hypothetical protein
LNALIAAGLVFFSGNFRLMFLAATIPYILDLINVASYPKNLDGELLKINRQEIWNRMRVTIREFGKVFSKTSVLRALSNSASFGGVFKSAKDYLQPILVALSLSFVIFSNLDEIRQEAIVIGLVYFIIYLLSSFASSRSYMFSDMFSSTRMAMNITYLVGSGFLVLSGLTTHWGWNAAAVGCFIGLFLINNIRRPINIGVISDQISSGVMASGLSTESQLTTIFSAVFAPFVGLIADYFGIGYGLAIVGVIMFLIYSFIRVR